MKSVKDTIIESRWYTTLCAVQTAESLVDISIAAVLWDVEHEVEILRDIMVYVCDEIN